MEIGSQYFTSADVGSESKAVLVSAALLCGNALDQLAGKFGKPEVLSWWLPVSELKANAYTKQMWDGYRDALGLPDTEYEAEKFAATVCPFMLGAAVAVRWKDPAAVFDFAKIQTSVFVDAVIMLPDSTMIIVSRWGTGKGFSDLLRTEAEVK